MFELGTDRVATLLLAMDAHVWVVAGLERESGLTALSSAAASMSCFTESVRNWM